jgi:hypothetical protein
MQAVRTSRDTAARQNLRFGKRLGREIYVASEASATPLQSYAPLSNFSALQCVALPWTPGTEMLSQPGLPVGIQGLFREGLFRGHSRYRRTATKQLISDGFSS